MITTLDDLVAFQAEQRPEQVALIETRRSARRLTYRALHHLATATAEAWRGGVTPYARVLIWLDKRLEGVVALLAAQRLGAILVVANPALKPEQIAYLLDDGQPTLIVTSSARGAALAPWLDPANGWQPLPLPEAFSALPQSVAPENDPVALFAAPSRTATAPLHHRTENDPAAIFYTSGSTGMPKGVVVSHRNLLAGAQSVVRYLGLRGDDRILAALPLSFDAGFSQLTTAWVAGATVVLHDHLLPRDTVAAIAEHQITALTAVPPLWRQLLNETWPESFAHHWRIAASTGGKMPPSWVEAWYARCPESPFTVMYGLTEAFRATYLPPAEWRQRPDSIGIPIPNSDILIVREDGTRAAPGEVGEIVQRGPLVALGYWNAPDKSAERFRPLPAALAPVGSAQLLPEIAVFSGDYGFCDDEGFLYFVGRRDAQIKTSGYRVSPEEVERVIHTFPGVVECCACGVDDPDLGQKIAVAVVVTGDDAVSERALLTHCRRHLATYQVPSLLWLTTAPLPRNPNGKIDRAAVAAHFAHAPVEAR